MAHCLGWVLIYTGNTEIFDELRSSGNLRVIKDRELVTAMLSYYNMAEDIGENYRSRILPSGNRLFDSLKDHGISPFGMSMESDVQSIAEIIKRDSTLRTELYARYESALYELLMIQVVLRPRLQELDSLVVKSISG